MKTLGFYGLLVLTGCLASCATPFGDAPAPGGGSGSSDGGTSDSGSGQTSGDTDSGGGLVPTGPEKFLFVAPATPPYVVQGKTSSVTITITRGGETASDIQITTTSVPPGVTVGSLTIPADSNTGQLLVSVPDSVAQGNLDGLAIQGHAVGGQASDKENLPLFVRGQPGALDTTFAAGGVIENTTNYYQIHTVAPQSDGTILIGAWTSYQMSPTGLRAASAVIRLKADGVVDQTLSGSNIQTITGPIYGVAADPDGRIVTAVAVNNMVYNISRYTADGAPDPTFNATNTPGYVAMRASPQIPADWSYLYPYAVAVGQDHNIYAGGVAYVTNDGSEPYAFLQIPDNGQPPDGQGSTSGCAGSPWDNTSNKEQITNLSLLPNGALAFAGYGVDLSTGLIVGVGVDRYSQPSPCTPDPNYGPNNDGVWYSTDWQALSDALFETDGSVDLLVGKTGASTYSLVRIDPTGKQTTKVDLPFSAGSSGITRAPAPDNRYFVAGQYPPASNASMAVAYYNTSNLTPDTSIGNKGVITIPVPTALTGPTGVGLRAVYMPDGMRTVVVGSMHGANTAGTAVEHLVVARIWN